jgi:subtilisin family serine protease
VLLSVAALVVTPAGAQGAVPSDLLGGSWVYEAVSLPQAWDLTAGPPSIAIAVVDSSVDASHPDLAGAVSAGYDFVDEDSNAGDLNGHGTAVAGIAVARVNNGLGAAGVCWKCRVLPLRVLRPEGFALKSVMAFAIDYAVAHGAAVVNVSLYGEDRNRALENSIRRARAAGVPVVTAAGNEGWTTREYPAAYSEAISVGATAEDDRLAGYSNRGDWVKLAAPGCVPTTQLGGGFGAGCGTSGASPVVAGIAALLRARSPLATVTQIEAALAETARPVAGVRFGLVNAFAALQRLGRSPPRFEPSIEGSPDVGSTLTAFTGIWAGAGVDVGFAWERCRDDACEPVGTGATYRVRVQDRGAVLRVTVSATGVPSALSPPTAPVPRRARNDVLPTVSGRAAVGSVLRGARGSWTGTTLSLTSRWLRCRTDRFRGGLVFGQGLRYRIRAADRGHRLRLLVAATNRLGTITAASMPTRRVV